jgi:hypothetical protein
MRARFDNNLHSSLSNDEKLAALASQRKELETSLAIEDKKKVG